MASGFRTIAQKLLERLIPTRSERHYSDRGGESYPGLGDELKVNRNYQHARLQRDERGRAQTDLEQKKNRRIASPEVELSQQQENDSRLAHTHSTPPEAETASDDEQVRKNRGGQHFWNRPTLGRPYLADRQSRMRSALCGIIPDYSIHHHVQPLKIGETFPLNDARLSMKLTHGLFPMWLERVNEEFRRRTKTQTSLPGEDAVLLLLYGLLRSAEIGLRRTDGRNELPKSKTQLEAA